MVTPKASSVSDDTKCQAWRGGYDGSVTAKADLSLAQRKRQLVSEVLTEAALRLLADRGFEAVTIDEIAAAAGVSKRTFFRYFASKEDVVVQLLGEMGSKMRLELEARPLTEPLSLALRETVWAAIAACADHPEQALPVVRLILGTPALLARFLERRAQWLDSLATEIAHRLDVDEADALFPRLAAGIALAAFDTVLQKWSASDGAEEAAALTDQAFTFIASALDTSLRE